MNKLLISQIKISICSLEYYKLYPASLMDKPLSAVYLISSE